MNFGKKINCLELVGASHSSAVGHLKLWVEFQRGQDQLYDLHLNRL